MSVWLFKQGKGDVKATKGGSYMAYVADFQSTKKQRGPWYSVPLY